MTRRAAVPVVLGAAAVLMVAGFVLTLGRVPVSWPDSQLYAYIARGRQLYGVGVPSALWFSPAAVDHIPFYGPVYFDLVALSFRIFGVSLASFRLICLTGALLIALAGAMLAKWLSGDRGRWLVVLTLLLLTPEIGVSATSGTMEPIAVAFEMLALAAFVRGLITRGAVVLHGAIAGVFLALAVLTTPRTLPLVVGFLVASAVISRIGRGSTVAVMRVQLFASMVVLVVSVCAWSVMSFGDPFRWFRYMAFILLREDSDVMFLPTAVRQWSFNWSSLVTPLFAIVAIAAVLIGVVRRPDPAFWTRQPDDAALFALIVTGVASLLTVVATNFTFTLGMYFAIPLLAVVLALPRSYFSIDHTLLGAAVVVLLACDIGIAGLKFARAAATWAARDPKPIADFVKAHVGRDAAVVGPDALYFFAVESAGARYRSILERSQADWARWVPQFDPAAVQLARDIHVPPPSGRFLIWQGADDLPIGYECARAHLVGTYTPPRQYLDRLGRLGQVWDGGYPATAIYLLPVGCPTGYDPTGTQSR